MVIIWDYFLKIRKVLIVDYFFILFIYFIYLFYLFVFINRYMLFSNKNISNILVLVYF